MDMLQIGALFGALVLLGRLIEAVQLIDYKFSLLFQIDQQKREVELQAERKIQECKEKELELLHEGQTLMVFENNLQEEKRRMEMEVEIKINELQQVANDIEQQHCDLRAQEINFDKKTASTEKSLKIQEKKLKKQNSRFQKAKAQFAKKRENLEKDRSDLDKREAKLLLEKQQHEAEVAKFAETRKSVPPWVYARQTGKKMGYCWKFWDGNECECSRGSNPRGLKHHCHTCKEEHPTKFCLLEQSDSDDDCWSIDSDY